MTTKNEAGTKAVGASDMDAEHQLLHDLLHQLQAALASGDRSGVDELLVRFEDVANLHFMEEQSLMRLHAYPGYEAHQQEHDELIGELTDLARRIRAGELTDASEAARSLEKWLMTHMNTTDAALESFLEEDGIRVASKS